MANPTYATITGADATNYQADRPTMLGQWRLSTGRWTTDGAPATADSSHASYPATAAYDGHLGSYTSPASAAQVWYYNGTLSTDHQEGDALFVHVDNAGHASTTVEVALSADIVTPTWLAISNVTAAFFQTGVRMFLPILQVSGDSGDTQRRFSDPTHIRIKFDAGGGNTGIPRLTELIFGRQRQLARRPTYPFDDYDRDSNVGTFVSASGIETSYTHYSGKYVLTAEHRLNGSTQRDKAANLYVDTGGFARPYIWCPEPYTEADTAYLMMMQNRKLRLPRQAPYLWRWQQAAIEQGGSLLVDE